MRVADLIAANEQPLAIARRLGHAPAAFTRGLPRGNRFEDTGSRAAAVAAATMVDQPPPSQDACRPSSRPVCERKAAAPVSEQSWTTPIWATAVS